MVVSLWFVMPMPSIWEGLIPRDVIVSATTDASEDQMSKLRDADSDGMPDWFEEQFGLNKSSAADAAAISLDTNGRYTNLEMYLHYLVKDIITAQNAGTTYQKL